MKKFIQLLIGLTVTTSFVLGLILYKDLIKTNAGWNGGPSTAALQCDGLQDCFDLPEAGWNSKI
jgi:hypothetical protein